MKYGRGILYIGGFKGHNGVITGYNTSMYYQPELNAIIVVSGNHYRTERDFRI